MDLLDLRAFLPLQEVPHEPPQEETPGTALPLPHLQESFLFRQLQEHHVCKTPKQKEMEKIALEWKAQKLKKLLEMVKKEERKLT